MKSIIDTATEAGNFKTLLDAVKRAGLVDTLKGKGPYTIFAPSDDAFSKLPRQELDRILNDRKQLSKILTYHVVPGKVMAQDVTKLKSAKTVQGQEIKIDTSKGVRVNDAQVTRQDIECSNGVIHVIDRVIMPK